MSTIDKSERSLIKKELMNERVPAVAFKGLRFAHKAAAGELFIDFNALVLPSELTGFVNPTPSELEGAEIKFLQDNVKLFSSARGWLLPYASYRIISNTKIEFTADFGASLADEIFFGFIEPVARTGTIVGDTDQILCTGELTPGQTTINVGKSFPVNYNANEKVGWVELYVDGELKLRNTGNSSSTLDEFYYENGAAVSTSLTLNVGATGGEKFVVKSSSVAVIRPDGSIRDEVERQAGVIDKVVEELAPLAGLLESDFQATPTQPQLKDFGDRVITLESGIGRGFVPHGGIIPYNPGYYTNSSNGGFTEVGPAGNTIANVNSFINPDGWYVCDGALVNENKSNIWNDAGRRLPNLTDDRFLMGNSAAGVTGGNNSINLQHDHSASSVGAIARWAPSATQSVGVSLSLSGSFQANQLNDSSAQALHDHSRGSYHAMIFQSDTEDRIWSRGFTAPTFYNYTVRVGGIPNTTAFTPVSTNQATEVGGTSGGSRAIFNNHAIDISFTGSSASGSFNKEGLESGQENHSHTINVNNALSSSTDIRPKYLSTFYIVRVF